MSEWPISLDRAEREIGVEHVERLRELRHWLYGIEREKDIKFRTAPSLVARSEVGLFDISMPRFAFRAYLTENSFVNARRIQTFCKLAKSWGQPPPGYDRDVNAESVEDRVQNASSCIGDSLLETPEKFPEKDYNVLRTELGLAYGEGEKIAGTPFVNHIRLGGGMCAQAVCFMVTALLQHAARGIYGVGEITALASPHEESVLDLGGINPKKICHYLNHPGVGLSALLQTVFWEVDNLSADNRDLLAYAEALRAYLLSDVPVILPVDFGRMCGLHNESGHVAEPDDESLFHRNGLADLKPVRRCLEESKKTPKTPPRPHAILVVGCHKPSLQDRNRWEFLVNDPTTYPFLTVSAFDLAKIRPYSETKEEIKTNLGLIPFISVAPREVRLPLLSSEVHGNRTSGLAGIADQIQLAYSALDLPPCLDTGKWLGEIRLVDLRWCLSGLEKDHQEFQDRLHHITIAGNGQQHLFELVKDGKIPAKWSWVQYCSSSNPNRSGSSIWIWDATVPTLPPDLTEHTGDFRGALGRLLRDKYLLAVLVCDATGRWQLEYPTTPVTLKGWTVSDVDGWQVPVPASEGLRPALISSFCTRGLDTVQSHYPKEAAVDLYAFMKPQVRQWLENNPAWASKCGDPSDPVTVMGDLADCEKAIADMARDVTRLFDPHNGQPIVALTSFVPEITSLQSDSYRQARNALRFLVNFAHALRKKGQPLRTVELVAGSRIGGIWPVANTEGRYMASRTDEDTARRRVLSVLGQLLAEYADQKPRDRVFLSIEMEPGPLYLLYGWNSLVKLCREIGRDPLLSKFVGVNLDIAHWILAGDITPEQVWDTPEVRDRIVHAHIAGHHRCSHLGDLHIEDLNKPEDFRPWIDLLRQIAADWRDPDLPQFSGHVSLEYEAAKEASHVTDCYTKVTDLLRDI